MLTSSPIVDTANILGALEDAEEAPCAEPLHQSMNESYANPNWEPWENRVSVSDDESDDSGEAEDGADEEDLQFLFMTSQGFEPIVRTPPHLKKPGARWMQRNAEREEWVSTSRKSLTQTKTMMSSFRAAKDLAPECHHCGALAKVRCTDCAPSGRYSCLEHSCVIVNCALIHNVDEEDDGGGFKPVPLTMRQWSNEDCAFCLRSFSRNTPTAVSTYVISLHTLRNGVVQVEVSTRQCSHCNQVSGKCPGQFGCTPGGKNMWVQNEVLTKDRFSYIAAEFRITQGARFKAKLAADAARGKMNGSSAEAQKYSDAWRIFCAVDNDQRVLSTRGGNKPPVEDLMDCPACANGCQAINIDACMKIRCSQHNSKSAAPPLETFENALGPIYIDSQGNAGDASMDAFRASRLRRLRGARNAPEHILYSSTACSSNFRAEADNDDVETSKVLRKSKIPGVAAPVCTHGMAIVRMIRMITTAGERAELTQYLFERILHECGIWPQFDVFGPAPVKTGNQRVPAPKFLVSDLACKIIPRLMKETPWVLSETTVALGKLHGAFMYGLSYNEHIA